jgi:hypothetical protein
MTSSRRDTNLTDVEDLVRRRDTLEQRLHDGDLQIREAARAGADTSGWEDLWISLLREYEAVCRELTSRGAVLRAAA